MMNMNILLDTHIAIFAIKNRDKLSSDFINVLENLDNKVYISMASAWEVAIKSINHPDRIPVNEIQFLSLCKEMEFELLPITPKHIINIRSLKLKNENVIHKDPFDRILLSQSECENLTFCTRDTLLLNYDTQNIKIV